MRGIGRHLVSSFCLRFYRVASADGDVVSAQERIPAVASRAGAGRARRLHLVCPGGIFTAELTLSAAADLTRSRR